MEHGQSRGKTGVFPMDFKNIVLSMFDSCLCDAIYFDFEM